MRWLAAAVIAVAVGGTCALPDDARPEQRGHSGASTERPVSHACAGHIDALIASRVVPRADREYAIGMCEAQR